MRRHLLYLTFFLLAFAPLCARAFDADDEQQFSISLDLLGNGASAPGGPSFSPGVGAQIFGDWRPLPYLSFGSGFSYSLHGDYGGWQLASFDLGGRIFPLGTGKGGEWYLQGTGGFEFLNQTLLNKWPGHLHGTAGVGYRAFVNSGNALDMGVQYDLFSPVSKPLQSIGVKVGWTFLIGDVPGQKPEPTPVATPAPQKPKPITSAPVIPKKAKKKKKAATPVGTPVPSANAPSTYIWAQGDILVSVAEAFFGNGDDFPLIVDANKAALGTPANLKAGYPLLIPQGVTDADKAAAEKKAGTDEYAPWKKIGAKATGFFN